MSTLFCNDVILQSLIYMLFCNQLEYAFLQLLILNTFSQDLVYFSENNHLHTLAGLYTSIFRCSPTYIHTFWILHMDFFATKKRTWEPNSLNFSRNIFDNFDFLVFGSMIQYLKGNLFQVTTNSFLWFIPLWYDLMNPRVGASLPDLTPQGWILLIQMASVSHVYLTIKV